MPEGSLSFKDGSKISHTETNPQKCPIAYVEGYCNIGSQSLNGMYNIWFKPCLFDEKMICRCVDDPEACIDQIRQKIGDPVTVRRMKNHEKKMGLHRREAE